MSTVKLYKQYSLGIIIEVLSMNLCVRIPIDMKIYLLPIYSVKAEFNDF